MNRLVIAVLLRLHRRLHDMLLRCPYGHILTPGPGKTLWCLECDANNTEENR